MPNHFHLIIKTNDGKSISNCVGNIKRITSRHITSYLKSNNKAQLLDMLKQKAKIEPSLDSRIWKPRFDCMVIVKEEILIQKIEYSHFNPVKAGLVKDILDWPYSSARNYAERADVLLDVDSQWKCLGY
jgi:REP element-mobilizing transposase RayT